MLGRLRGRAHTVYSAVEIVGRDRVTSEVVETLVGMREYEASEVEAYVESGDPLDKAGAYAIQHPQFSPVSSWEGCYANVMGLPLCTVIRALRAWSITPAVHVPTACQAYIGERCEVFHAILPD
jgi:predicted house-cleaning NTP pyrophosphatase (Maf/HAM1 superfamily)